MTWRLRSSWDPREGITDLVLALGLDSAMERREGSRVGSRGRREEEMWGVAGGRVPAACVGRV